MKTTMTNANFPVDAEGRVYHVAVKAGEVANRIVTAGDPARVRRFATFLDKEPVPFEVMSSRGYLTITGRYKGVPVTLLAIGMGFPMMDFMVREVRHVTEGDLAIIRFGSCGSLDPTLKVGSVGVPQNCVTIQTQYDHWYEGSGDERVAPWIVSKPIPADSKLQQTLMASLNSSVASPASEIRDIKLHASADLFYSSQGRIDDNFEDHNEPLIAELVARYPDLTSLEMETAHLFHLSHISKKRGRISAAAAHMIFASRSPQADSAQSFIPPALVEELEPAVGKACLDAIIAFDIPEDRLHPEEGSVWKL